MLKKWNFAVILSLNHKWVVEILKFGSYFMINCGETIFSVISGFWIVTGWRHIWSWRVYLIDSPNFWMSFRWPARCIKREENVINIAKPCIHKAAGSGIDEVLFPIFSWRYMLFIIHKPGLEKRFMQIYFCVGQKILKPPIHLCQPFSPLHIAFCQLSVLGFHCFFTTHHNNCFVSWNVFHIRDEKIPYATLHQTMRDRYFTKRWM